MDFVFWTVWFDRPLLTRDWKFESVTDQPTDGPTNQPTNQPTNHLTWVGARDTYVSKNTGNSFFQFFLYFSPFLSFYVIGKNVSLAYVKRTTLKNRCCRLFFTFCPSSQNCNCNGGVPRRNVYLFFGKVTSIEMRLCDLTPFSTFSTFSLLSFLFRFSNR